MQRLPKQVFSVLGNMPLLRGPEDCPDDAFGIFKKNDGVVAIAPDVSDRMLWPTYWHEAAHVALYDSGCENHLTNKQLEAICDAMGTYLAAMMSAGMLQVTTPRNS